MVHFEVIYEIFLKFLRKIYKKIHGKNFPQLPGTISSIIYFISFQVKTFNYHKSLQSNFMKKKWKILKYEKQNVSINNINLRESVVRSINIFIIIIIISKHFSSFSGTICLVGFSSSFILTEWINYTRFSGFSFKNYKWKTAELFKKYSCRFPIRAANLLAFHLPLKYMP